MGAGGVRCQVDRHRSRAGGRVPVRVLQSHREGVGGQEFAAPVKAVEVMASWVPPPVAAVMVSCCVPELSPLAAAVMVGVPARSSP